MVGNRGQSYEAVKDTTLRPGLPAEVWLDGGPERQRHLSTRFGRLVDAQNQLQRLPPGPAICIRLCLAPKNGEDVSVVPLVTEAVHVRWVGVYRLDQLVVVVVLSELPVV